MGTTTLPEVLATEGAAGRAAVTAGRSPTRGPAPASAPTLVSCRRDSTQHLTEAQGPESWGDTEKGSWTVGFCFPQRFGRRAGLQTREQVDRLSTGPSRGVHAPIHVPPRSPPTPSETLPRPPGLRKPRNREWSVCDARRDRLLGPSPRDPARPEALPEKHLGPPALAGDRAGAGLPVLGGPETPGFKGRLTAARTPFSVSCCDQDSHPVQRRR